MVKGVSSFDKKKEHQIDPQQAALHILQSVTKHPEKASKIKREHQDYQHYTWSLSSLQD